MPSLTLVNPRGTTQTVTELAALEHYLRRGYTPQTGTIADARTQFTGQPATPPPLETGGTYIPRGAGGITLGPAAPASPTVGDVWIDTSAALIPTTGTVAVYDAANITGVADGGNVATWAEPNGLPLTAYNSPKLYLAGPNGQPYVSFDGTTQYAENTALTNPSASTEVLVCRMRANSPNGSPMNSAAAGAARALFGNTTTTASVWCAYAGSTVTGTKLVVPGEWVIIVATFGTTAELRANRTIKTGSSGGNTHGGLRLGRAEGTSTAYSPADIAYARIYSRALTAAEILNTESALATRYGVTLP
jgi:hypothetical protein